ncbi:MAG: hypothetical protein AB7F98_06000 [Novosphingobium sp.]
MEPITIDGLEEEEFRCSIEAMLREGQADDAAAKLRVLIEPYVGDGRTLPARFLTVSPGDIVLKGWDELGNQLGRYDRPGHWVSAIGVSIVDPSEAEAFAQAPAGLAPCLETSFYSDDAFPFSKSGREDLLEGYSRHGAEWQGNFEQADMTLAVSGVEDLYQAIADLEARLLDSQTPDSEEICAGSLGACYLSVLLHQAVRDKIRNEGLPRPLCVMTGCVGVYPFFDAPVVSSYECLDGGFIGIEASATMKTDRAKTDDAEEAEADDGFGSLLSLTPRIAKKKMAIEVGEEDAAAATRQFELASATQLAEAGDAHHKPPKSDFAAIALSDFAEAPIALEDDDWSEIPDATASTNFDPEVDQEIGDWFDNLADTESPAETHFPEVSLPVSEGVHWDLPETAGEGGEFPTRLSLEDPVETDRLASGAEDDDDRLLDGDDVEFDLRTAYHIPAQPAVGHGLRAKLAGSLQTDAPKSEGRFALLLRRLLARIKSRF